MTSLPTGTVTFLFTDIEGSTHLLQQLGDHYADVLVKYRRLLRSVSQENSGHVVDTQGDSFLIAFPRAKDALGSAVEAQRSIVGNQWPQEVSVRVRMGLHTGEPLRAETGYVGMDVHRAARICAAGHGGQILLSETTRALIAEDLPREVTLRDLGKHSLKDLAYPQHLFQVIAADLPGDFPPLKSLSTLPNNLPRQLTSFIGREREVTEVRQLLSARYLLTLTGAGGAGKTRLALQVAAELLEEYADGVWVVELAALSDPALVPQMVASVFSVCEEPGRKLTETLLDHLRGGSFLLVLDNCEHLLPACAELASTLLRGCPTLRMMATSREALGIEGETAWRVPSLSLPDLQRLPPVEHMQHYEAVRLFIERARASVPSFAMTNQTARTVAQVCVRLDGIPLAIELAAARVRVLGVEQIAERLDDRFQILTGGSRMAIPRHKTLRAAMDWSYDLLSDAQRALLRRLSVFAGGFTLEAVESICSGKGIDTQDVLDLLTSLVDKSLVTAEAQERVARYEQLETVRRYAGERLLESNETGLIYKLHRDWFLALAERAEPELRGRNQAVWLNRLDVEYNNLRVALNWSKTETDASDAGLRLASALWLFWDMHAYYTEGREWLEGMLSRRGGTPVRRAKGLNGAGVLAYRQGDYERVSALCTEALAICEEHGDKWGRALSLHYLAHVGQSQGDHAHAEEMMENSVALYRDLGDKWGLALSTNCLGDVARSQRNYEKAAALLEESLALSRQLGDKWITALSLHNLGHVMQHQGNSRQATVLFRESLNLTRELGFKMVTIMSLAGLAGATASDVQPERAAKLLGAADALITAIGVRLEPADRPDFDRNVAEVRARLSQEAFASAWAKGQAMTLEQTIEYALSES